VAPTRWAGTNGRASRNPLIGQAVPARHRITGATPLRLVIMPDLSFALTATSTGKRLAVRKRGRTATEPALNIRYHCHQYPNFIPLIDQPVSLVRSNVSTGRQRRGGNIGHLTGSNGSVTRSEQHRPKWTAHHPIRQFPAVPDMRTRPQTPPTGLTSAGAAYPGPPDRARSVA
jgi:hypothetical protein